MSAVADPLQDVSRETIARLNIYAALLKKWNPRINLVSKTTLEAVWQRHIIDSAQLFQMAPHPVRHWADLGSGGGFPGLVIAILAQDSPQKVTLVESDTRKCTFLRTVLRETGVEAEIINDRIENIAPLNADILSARALAELAKLLEYSIIHLNPKGTALFPKGSRWEKEVKTAQAKWQFTYGVDKSITETGPVILSITGVSRA